MIRSNMTPAQVASAARKDVGQVLAHVAEKHAELGRKCPNKGSDQLERRSGNFISRRSLNWTYVVTAYKERLTTYPLLWYPTTQGIRALQVDAKGPAAFLQEHVMEQFLERYMRKGDLMNAMREFQLHNYDKVYFPHPYKGDPMGHVAVVDDGYLAGEYLYNEAVIYIRTFYDQKAGHRKFGQLRAALTWRAALHQTEVLHTGRKDTPHTCWGRGYVRTTDQWGLAA